MKEEMTLEEHKAQASRTMQHQMKQKQKKYRDNHPDLPMTRKEKWIRTILALILVPPMMYWMVTYLVPRGY